MPDAARHHRGDDAVARLDLVAPPAPAAPATSSRSSCATATTTATSRDKEEEEEEDGFTFAAVAVPRLQAAGCPLQDARIGGPVYPVFGRPRWSPPKQHHQQEKEDPAGTGSATVPLGRLLLEDLWCDCDCAPSASGQQPADEADTDAELDGVPADTYCLWSPGVSPPAPAGSSRQASPAGCRKSGSTGSSVLRWRRQRRRSHSDGKDDRFVFLGTSSDRIGAGEGHGCWMDRGSAAWGGGSKSTTTSLLPCKQDLVGLVASAVAFRRSCLPF